MLEEYLKLYETQASLIENWKKINKNVLCKLCIENENNPRMYEAYLSAIVARYWKSMSKLYTSCKFGVSEEECYQWLIDSVLYALDHRSWEDPNSSIYNDPNGPDKVINRCMKSRRLTHYQLLNKDKRVANLNTISIEAAEDDFGDYATDSLGLVEEETSPLLSTVTGMIYNCASSGDIFISMLLDMIINEDILDGTSKEPQNDSFSMISRRKILQLLCNDGDRYVRDFLSRNNLPDSAKTDADSIVKNMTAQRLSVLLPRALSALRTAKMRRLLYK